MRSLVLFFIVFSAHGQSDCTVSGQLLHQEFLLTAFGKESRTIDVKDAESVVARVKKYVSENPKNKIEKIQVTVCTSAWSLKGNENLDLAKQRSDIMSQELKKLTWPSEVSYRVCGPEFDPKDLNDRFVTRESPLFQERFERLLANKELRSLYTSEALVENMETLLDYSSPFQAKYRPFQGNQIKIWGSAPSLEYPCLNSSPASSSKATKQ